MKKHLIIIAGFLLINSSTIIAQTKEINADNWTSSPGIIGTIVLGLILLGVFILITVIKTKKTIHSYHKISRLKNIITIEEDLLSLEVQEIDQIIENRKRTEKVSLNEVEKTLSIPYTEQLINICSRLDHQNIDQILNARHKVLSYSLRQNELGSDKLANDDKGMITYVNNDLGNPIYDDKRSKKIKLETDQDLIKIVITYIGASAFWLVLGTFIGQYIGMKFVWPEIDSISWLSFGRLRPVHTNTVFWGWASLAMIGLGYFVISRTSNQKIYSTKIAWKSFWLINATLIIGNICLMAGVNNGGGEYREYIWPVMLLFAVGLILTAVNYYRTIASRKVKEIYISNWYILAACVWTIILSIIGYLPFTGLGETITQGYYMHQGVGMWFMTFTLGLVYYFLPSSLNKPIYSYSLGTLAFWTQMLFYTLIGTHHFVFSPLPWWLQTVAIVFSGGMFIPVLAGSSNFLLTMKGSFKSIADSYVLPFLLVGVIFYFLGSVQGSFQAFRFTNYVWHFTDFNVAHSHLTMYGIISFLLWGCTYALLPKLTGHEPTQLNVGLHFWLAFVGLIIYTFSLMIGGTQKGLSWIEGETFIKSVNLMAPYWLWRAIGGSLMFISHIIFAVNIYQIYKKWDTNKIEKK